MNGSKRFEMTREANQRTYNSPRTPSLERKLSIMQRLDSQKWNSIIPNEKCPILIFIMFPVIIFYVGQVLLI